MKKVLLIADQYLDPRLRRRVKWFKDAKYDVSVSYYRRANWFRNKTKEEFDNYIEYKNKRILNFKNAIIYISGARALIDNFLYLIKLKKNNIIVIEIPDLPLRSKHNFINNIILTIFNKIINLLTKNIIVTSDSFIKKLPKNKNYLFLENIIDYNYAKDIYAIKQRDLNNKRIKIGYIGVIRYMQQLQMIVDFCAKHNNIEFHIYGDPIENLNLLNTDFNKYPNIYIHGKYIFENDIINIYKNIDIVYSVYDASQPNVKLALPNKLYEAILAKKWFIAANDTYLGVLIADKNIGLSVPYNYSNYQDFERQMNIFITNIKYNKIKYNTQESIKVLNKSLKQNKIFIDYIKGCK